MLESKFFTFLNVVTAICFGVALYFQIAESMMK